MYLERLLTILETISSGGKSASLSVSDIAAATGVPKPSLYRQVNDLVDAGLLEPRENGRYAIGVRTRRLSDAAISQDDAKQLAVPLLKSAVRKNDVVFFLSQRSGASVDIIHAEVPSNGVSYLHPGIGARPLHACSCGKAIAAFCDDVAVSNALSGQLRAYTEHTKTDPRAISAEIERIRTQGYAECVEELEHGICSVAAPVKIQGQPARYSLGATGTLRVFTPGFRSFLGERLIVLAEELARLLDYTEEGAHRSANVNAKDRTGGMNAATDNKRG